MVDTNRPVAWQVVDRQTGKVVAEYQNLDAAHGEADRREPFPECTGYRFVVEPVRASELSNCQRKD